MIYAACILSCLWGAFVGYRIGNNRACRQMQEEMRRILKDYALVKRDDVPAGTDSPVVVPIRRPMPPQDSGPAEFAYIKFGPPDETVDTRHHSAVCNCHHCMSPNL